MLDEVLPDDGAMSLNYGVNRVRFPAPVPSGSRVRGRFRVTAGEDTPAGERGTMEATLECDRTENPVCVAELVVLTVS
jgi:acyl dehydratase